MSLPNVTRVREPHSMSLPRLTPAEAARLLGRYRDEMLDYALALTRRDWQHANEIKDRAEHSFEVLSRSLRA